MIFPLKMGGSRVDCQVPSVSMICISMNSNPYPSPLLLMPVSDARIHTSTTKYPAAVFVLVCRLPSFSSSLLARSDSGGRGRRRPFGRHGRPSQPRSRVAANPHRLRLFPALVALLLLDAGASRTGHVVHRRPFLTSVSYGCQLLRLTEERLGVSGGSSGRRDISFQNWPKVGAGNLLLRSIPVDDRP